MQQRSLLANLHPGLKPLSSCAMGHEELSSLYSITFPDMRVFLKLIHALMALER